MDVNEVIDRARESITVRRVFGEPIQGDGVTLVPVARVSGGGGGGGGGGEGPQGESNGSGSGFGLSGRPAGAYVIRGGEVRWLPAMDPTRIILASQALVGLLALLWLQARRLKLRASPGQGLGRKGLRGLLARHG